MARPGKGLVHGCALEPHRSRCLRCRWAPGQQDPDLCIANEDRAVGLLQALATSAPRRGCDRSEKKTHPAHVGENSARNLSTKAAETKHLLPFCLEMLVKYQARLPAALAAQYKGIGEAMQGLVVVMQREGFATAPPAIQSMYDELNRMFRLWLAVELSVKLKLHLLMHLCDRAPFQGNPAFYATWADETLNKVLASLGRQAHRSVWECRILCYFEQTQSHARKKRRF